MGWRTIAGLEWGGSLQANSILRALLKRLIPTLKRLVQTRLEQTFVRCPKGLMYTPTIHANEAFSTPFA